MRLSGSTPVHLTYCTNIHPAERWDEVLAALRTHTLTVRRQVAPDQPFGLGLRLSARAAAELAAPDALASFADFLREHDCYVFTLNGFPYGPFSGQAVKEAVYRPDWREPERLRYTDTLANLLARLAPRAGTAPRAPDGLPLHGSISTVPGCFRPDARRDPDAPARIVRQLVQHAVTLHRLAREEGVTIALALEPEPACLLETTAEACTFIADALHGPAAARQFAALAGCTPGEAATALHTHLGLCLDACHAAVEFEEPDEALSHVARTGVRLLKLQVTAGLTLAPVTADALAALSRFEDAVYLHQTVVRGRDGELRRHLDLPAALADARAHGSARDDAWRVHYHVPLYHADFSAVHPALGGTQAFTAALLARHARAPLTAHLEVETYTWAVLPPALRALPVADAIARELRWAGDRLAPSPAASAPPRGHLP